MGLILAVFLLAVELLRHVPQAIMDIRSRRRKAVLEARSWARPELIMIGHLIVVIISIFSIGSGSINVVSLVIGLMLFITGIIVGMLALRSLSSSHAFSEMIVVFKDSRLVTSGIYGFIRHPLRLGLSLELLGLIVISGTLPLVPIWCVIVLLQVVRTIREDAMLREHYGKAAEEYQHHIPAVNFFKALQRSYGKESTRVQSPAV